MIQSQCAISLYFAETVCSLLQLKFAYKIFRETMNCYMYFSQNIIAYLSEAQKAL